MRFDRVVSSPVRRARRTGETLDSVGALGATIVIAVDVIYPSQDATLFTVLDVILQAFTISMNRLRDYELRTADVVIAPAIPPTSGQLGLGERERLVHIGRTAANAAWLRIQELLRSER